MHTCCHDSQGGCDYMLYLGTINQVIKGDPKLTYKTVILVRPRINVVANYKLSYGLNV